MATLLGGAGYTLGCATYFHFLTYALCSCLTDNEVDFTWLYTCVLLYFADNKTTIVLLNHFSRVTFSFHMRRRPLYYIVNLIIPCCLLSFIAVVTFVLPASCSERLGLSTSMLRHTTVLGELQWWPYGCEKGVECGCGIRWRISHNHAPY